MRFFYFIVKKRSCRIGGKRSISFFGLSFVTNLNSYSRHLNFYFQEKMGWGIHTLKHHIIQGLNKPLRCRQNFGELVINSHTISTGACLKVIKGIVHNLILYKGGVFLEVKEKVASSYSS